MLSASISRYSTTRADPPGSRESRFADYRLEQGRRRRWAVGGTLLKAFGPEWSVFAADLSVDRLLCAQDLLVDAFTDIMSGSSRDQHAAMFSGNAERLYGI